MNNKIIIHGEDLTPYREKALDFCQKIANWILACQRIEHQAVPETGTYYFDVDVDNTPYYAPNWSLAFCIMGLLGMHKETNDEKYRNAALRMARYLKTLQIFDPFHKEDYGAFREYSAQTPWCYTRDALSAAWGMVELYRETNEQEYLDRALLWYDWFQRRGMDEYGWPLWGRQFDPAFAENGAITLHNELHGCFHGGSLNFFYQLAKTTGNDEHAGAFYINIADRFINEIQQEDGFFRTTLASTGKVRPDDPQGGLHRGNDDLGTLGLLGVYRRTGDKKYLAAIEKFLTAAFGKQQEDGSFETYCAANPVILNILFETNGLLENFKLPQGAAGRLLDNLFSRQVEEPENPLRHGGIREYNDGHVCARSACYSLIVLLKVFGKGNQFLSAR